MTIKILDPIKGRLLVSIPFMNDQFFGRSVVLLTEHNEEGSVGFILNKPLETTINDAIPDFPDFDSILYIGGPVESKSLFYLHTMGDIVPESIEIMDGLYWGGSFEAIKILVSEKVIQPDNIKFFVGYSGWGPNQLGKELKENSWLVQKSSIKNIMATDLDNLWKFSIKKTGKQFSIWADFPVNPSLN